jgi:NitT/TauT family transport system permease protein
MAWRVGLLVAALGSWEALSALGLVRTFWISSPSLILTRFAEYAVQGDMWFHLLVTMEEAFAGLLVGGAVGVLLGLVIGVSKTLGPVLEPFVIALNSLPRVALGPLLVMYVGIGFASKFFLAFSLVAVPVMLNTYEGVRSIDQTLVNVMRTLQASRYELFFKLLLPNSIPWILSAMRSAVSFAIVGAIVGEFVSAQAGIGYMIDQASGAFDTTGIMVPLFVLMVIGYALDCSIVALSRHLLRWRKLEVN